MKTIALFDPMKCLKGNECNHIQYHKIKTEKEEINLQASRQAHDNVKQDNASKLNFQLFDIDQVFAN